MTGFHWVQSNSGYGIPSTAVEGGVDADGSNIYVGRAYHCGDWIPAKIVPARNEAYVAYGGEEIVVHHFEILCEQRFQWISASNGHIPQGAVEGGRTSEQESLYIGRAWHEGTLTVGKVHSSHGCCYIPFGGFEHKYNSYEVLVLTA